MFGLKWPWVARRERLAREAAQREAERLRQAEYEAAREVSRRFVAEQEEAARAARQAREARERQRLENQLRDYHRGVLLDMSMQRKRAVSPPSKPDAAPVARSAVSPVVEEPSRSVRVLWEEPMIGAWATPAPVCSAPAACEADPKPVRGGGGSFDGGGASGDWSSSDSSGSDTSSSAGSD